MNPEELARHFIGKNGIYAIEPHNETIVIIGRYTPSEEFFLVLEAAVAPHHLVFKVIDPPGTSFYTPPPFRKKKFVLGRSVLGGIVMQGPMYYNTREEAEVEMKKGTEVFEIYGN